MTKEIHEVLEIAQIAAIMSDEGRMDVLYQKCNLGYMNTSYKIAEYALSFYLENENTNWEERLDTEGCWDDCIINFVKDKIENYDRG